MHLKRCALKWDRGNYRLSNPVDYMDEMTRNEYTHAWVLRIPTFLFNQFHGEKALLDRYVTEMSRMHRGSCVEYEVLKMEWEESNNTKGQHLKVLLKFDDATNDNPSYSTTRMNNFLTFGGIVYI
ncbi:Uncharacterized protein FKW44_007163 [Caligus rogercresseyi]|uniref:Uncharacterized protein n=1 Tax=Caligus rogercresseyi TaxID=217165 RepID=A0A7T8KEM6_CALRO|nr:Uncharacterized protein FKW44_007163 [Caligus rogercresseyi]